MKEIFQYKFLQYFKMIFSIRNLIKISFKKIIPFAIIEQIYQSITHILYVYD